MTDVIGDAIIGPRVECGPEFRAIYNNIVYTAALL